MKKCLICGEENQDISKYCHMCGFKFVSSEPEEEEVVIPKPVRRELLKKKRNPFVVKKTNVKITKDMVFICIIIVLVIGFALFYKANPKGNSNNHDVMKALQMYEQKHQQNPSSSWDFKYKNDFAPEGGKQQVDLFE